MKRVLRVGLSLSCVLGLSTIAHAVELQWSAYDTNGNLVVANAGIGGDLIDGDNVTLTVPAGQTYIFVTQNFAPVDNSQPSTTNTITYNFNAQGLGVGNGVFGRPFGVGLFNTAGTPGTGDDYGYFAEWNPAGPYPETFTHSGQANLFAGTQQGQGGIYQGLLQDNVTYAGAIRPRTSSSGNIALGYGSSFAAAGTTWTDNNSVTNTAYINATAPPGGYNKFDEFSVYLSNTTNFDETVTLDSITLTPVTVPEPSSLVLAGLGLLGLISARRLRK